MERPILFSTPMVRAIKSNNKYQTRRTRGLEEINKAPWDWMFHQLIEVSLVHGGPRFISVEFINETTGNKITVHCPYGCDGDTLWVRETFAVDQFGTYGYKADEILADPSEVKWKPSIHMPREAARLFLKITDIRVERLNSISEGAAVAEGVETLDLYPGYKMTSKQKFAGLWTLLNDKEGTTWDDNPWVWVITFEKQD